MQMRPTAPRRGTIAHYCQYIAGLALSLALLAALAIPFFHPHQAHAIIAPSGPENLISRNLENNCAACHHFDPQLSHPIGIRPQAAPANLTLDNGLISCITCHDSAAAAGHQHRHPRGHTFLRAHSPAALCASCHTTSDTRAHSHATTARAHLQSPPPRTAALDPESQTCISCHDGAVAADAAMNTRLINMIPDINDHPIGIPYSQRRGHDAPALHPAHSLDPRIRLFDGALGCGSCHSLYSQRRKLLVMDNDRSQLCLSCHAE